MDRRTYLRSVAGLAALTASAGCPADESNSTNPATESAPSTATPEPSPSISWTEEWLEGTAYRLTVTVELDSLDEVHIMKGTPSSDPMVTLTSSGTHTIAGPDTEYGPIEGGRMLIAGYPLETSLDLEQTKSFGDHMVGTQEEPSFPMFLNGLSGSTDPNLEQSGSIQKTFTQDVGSRKTNLTIQVPEVLSSYYANRTRTRNYGAYVSDSYDDSYIQSIVSEFETYGNENGLSDREIINHMMGFVQHLEYSTDEVSTGYNEYPKYPTETLLDKGGDCEDTCILLASMLEQFGYGAVLLAFYDAQHMALGIAGEDDIQGSSVTHNGQRYYYVETTDTGWTVGEAPEQVQGHSPEVISIRSHPVLVFSYGVQVSPKGGVTVNGGLKNVGDAVAETAQLRVQFQDGQQNTLTTAESDPQTIPVGGDTELSVSAVPPDDTKQRVEVSVLLDGSIHDSMTSEYRTPNGD
ncbi:copper amine oxidase [Halosimplex litoreum]|nr:copper amine oxidase [Halosimplex litoreum]